MCDHVESCDLNGSHVCLDCGLVLGAAEWGPGDYNHDEDDFIYKTPSPDISQDVPEKKVALVVDTVCRVKILRPEIHDAAFYIAQDLYSEFFTFKIRKRLKPMLVFDCLLYYVANYQGHYQFYEIWHYNRLDRDLKQWHRCETILAQTLGLRHREVFEFKINLKEALVQLCEWGGLTGRDMMRASRRPPSHVHDLFQQCLELFVDYCQHACPDVLERPKGRFLLNLRKRTKPERI